MRLKFKTLTYETNAIEFVVDCFDGQPISSIWPRADINASNKRRPDKGVRWRPIGPERI
jgi:hypothetical protein